ESLSQTRQLDVAAHTGEQTTQDSLVLESRGCSHGELRRKLICVEGDLLAAEKKLPIDKLIALAQAAEHAKLRIGETWLDRFHSPMIPRIARRGTQEARTLAASLQNQHAVAEPVKAISLRHGVLIGAQDEVPARKRRDQ